MDHMGDLSEFVELERATADAIRAVQRVNETLRALTPVMEQLWTLQNGLAELQSLASSVTSTTQQVTNGTGRPVVVA